MEAIFHAPSLKRELAMSGPYGQDGSFKQPRMIGTPWLEGADEELVGADGIITEYESQQQVSYEFRMRASKFNGATRDAPRHCSIWINKGIAAEKPDTGAYSTRMVHAVSAHYLNFILADRTYNWSGPEAADTSVEWFRNNFGLAGIMHTDNLPPFEEQQFTSGQRVVVTLRKHAFMQLSNVWPGAVSGDHLWFIIKPVPVGNVIAYEPVKGVMASVRTARADRLPVKYPGHVVQIVPHSTRTPAIANEDLHTYATDVTGCTEILQGFAVRLGRVAEDPHREPVDAFAAMQRATELARCPLITVVLNI